MIVMNTSDKALPTPFIMSDEVSAELADLEYRSTIGRSGEDGSGRKPLSVPETIKLRDYKMQQLLARAPKWDGREYEFAAKGKQGCAWEILDKVAFALCRNYNSQVPVAGKQRSNLQILVTIRPDQLPEGIVPVRKLVDDPLSRSSEAYYKGGVAGGVLLSKGSAEPPPGPADVRAAAMIQELDKAGVKATMGAR